MSFLEKEVCNYIPDIRKLGIKDIDENQFYKLIGLTHDEIQLFNKNNIINDNINTQSDEIVSNTQSNEIITVSKQKTSKSKSKIKTKITYRVIKNTNI